MNWFLPLGPALVAGLFGALVVAIGPVGCEANGPRAGDASEAIPGFGPDGVGAEASLDVTPREATVEVKIVDGVVVDAPPRAFVATYRGRAVDASWTIDRGELGHVDASGVFVASGEAVGRGRLVARVGAREGIAKVRVVVHATHNGASSGAESGGLGGVGGVGGEPIGGRVDAAVATKLRAGASANGAKDLTLLYPYDGTVWPRGLLPPLVMWQTEAKASAVYVKLSREDYVFEGTYALDARSSNDATKRVRFEAEPWRTATSGEGELALEVKVYAPSDDRVYGPSARAWNVAPGGLRGTVYYSSYDSAVTGGGGEPTGGVIQIKPRSPEPELAIASMSGKCHACHVVSADGSTLFAQDGKGVYPNGPDDYRNGASYDLRDPASMRTAYRVAQDEGHERKFVWAAPYPDGSFALASSGYAREAYTKGPSELFRRVDGARLASTNLGAVSSAVTPAFSPDGRKVAFNFWAGSGANGVAEGRGHSLAVFDFSCGAAPGSIACAAGVTPTFDNLREIYRDDERWPAWPSFLPDGKAVVFHDTLRGGDAGADSGCHPGVVEPLPSADNCQLTTWLGATAEIWLANDDGAPRARRLDALNGIGPDGRRYLPVSPNHPNDEVLNYMPTVNPVASGGYYWVVFTSRRLYGNVLTGDPHAWGGAQKKLWVAAIDVDRPDPTADPSHPAFYLPGQELDAGNTRGFWAVDPCKADGAGCEAGDECCTGFCRAKTGGARVCQGAPAGACAEEFERCTSDADCCPGAARCLAGRCAKRTPTLK